MSAPTWRSALNAALRAPLPELDKIRPDTTVVVACLWRRIDALPDFLSDLNKQHDVALTVVLWNNHRLTERAARRAAARYPDGGAIAEVHVLQRKDNIGGIARFVVANHLHRRGYDRPMIMVDDDMRMGPSVCATLLSRFDRKSYLGHWAWNPNDGYHSRTRALDGEPAAYVGTGGSIVDVSLADAAFFELLPDRFGAVEDLWASGIAQHRGWNVACTSIDTEYLSDNEPLYVALSSRKTQLWELLPALVRGKTVAVEPDDTAGLSRISGREVCNVWVGRARRIGARLARRLHLPSPPH